ncbi:MAG: hypothetical protein R2795_22510 [Saprospiraceae bacterium]
MGLVRFNPTLVNRVFDDFFTSFPTTEVANRPAFRATLPAVNVKETENEYLLELAAPAFAKKTSR